MCDYREGIMDYREGMKALVEEYETTFTQYEALFNAADVLPAQKDKKIIFLSRISHEKFLQQLTRTQQHGQGEVAGTLN